MTLETVNTNLEESCGIAAYVRVSTQDQSWDLQKDAIHRKLSAMGVDKVKFYQDKATGTNGDRPGLRSLNQDIREGKIKTVLVWKIDRLFRSLKHMVNTINEWQELGVNFISIQDNLDPNTASGKMMFQLLAVFAEFEASLIKERVMAGQQAAKNKGVKFGRKRKLDYDKIFKLRTSGATHAEIAKEIGGGVLPKTIGKICQRYKL